MNSESLSYLNVILVKYKLLIKIILFIFRILNGLLYILYSDGMNQLNK